MTDGLCVQAAQLIFEYLPHAYADGTDMDAREKMHNAATLAGLGFGNAMASMAHAMGHALGAVFHIPHGRAVSLFLPYTIEFIARESPERLTALARSLSLPDGALALADAIRQLCREINVPVCVAELEIERDTYIQAVEKLVDNAFNDTSMLTAARAPSYDELMQIFRYAYEGTRIDF
jgi:alcohol dehydrogenase class IV